MQSLLSLLSGSTAPFVLGYARYLSQGDPSVRPLEIAGVLRVPDLQSYINAKGLSLELVTGYRVSRHFYFELAYERIAVGDTEQQLTTTVHYQLASLFPALQDFWVTSDVVIGGGVGGSLELKWSTFPLAGVNQEMSRCPGQGPEAPAGASAAPTFFRSLA